jgi:autotransporter passenger strand-loop-strand repeat protein
MTTYTAPPDQTGLDLKFGDILNVNSGGTATGTTIYNHGLEDVRAGGVSYATVIDSGGGEQIRGESVDTIINNGGQERVLTGKSVGTIINNGGEEVVFDGGATSIRTTVHSGGLETVYGGTAIDTTIDGGTEMVIFSGLADNVVFAGTGSRLELALPSVLKGTVSNFHVGDVIDLLNTAVTGLTETGNTLTVTYGNDQKAIYTLAGQQSDTHFTSRSDGHGGTDLILTPIVGVPHLEAAIHFGPGPHLHF